MTGLGWAAAVFHRSLSSAGVLRASAPFFLGIRHELVRGRGRLTVTVIERHSASMP